MERILKLARIGRTCLKKNLEHDINLIEGNLVNLNRSNINFVAYNRYLSKLQKYVKNYEGGKEKIKLEFGVKFTELQKKYEAMLPEINKYLDSAEEKIN